MTDTDWWNLTGLHTYAHPDHEVEDMGHPHICLRHPTSGLWFTLRDLAPQRFIDLWDDGLGEPVIPCPGDHVFIPSIDSRGFTLFEVSIDAEPGPGGGCVTHVDGYPFRLADSVVVRREDLEDQPSLMAVIRAEQEAAGRRSTFANAEDVREAMWATLTATYEPTGLILHPEDHRQYDCIEQVRNVPEDALYRRANQMRIADAFGIPYWIAGVEGAKPPVKVRVRSFVRSLPRRVLTTIPGVTYWGPRETGEGWMNAEPAEPRAWHWGAHVGNYRIGTTPHDPWSCGDDCTETHP